MRKNSASADAGEADHRRREQLAADDRDRDHDRDPGQRPGDPGERLRAAAPRALALVRAARLRAESRRRRQAAAARALEVELGVERLGAVFGRRTALHAQRPPKRRWRRSYSSSAAAERLAPEVGPELVAEDELRVGALPEQEVRDPLLAAGPDQQVGIVHLGRVEAAAEVLLGAALEASRGVDDLRPAAVVEGDEERDPVVGGGRAPRPTPCARRARRRRPRGGRRTASAHPRRRAPASRGRSARRTSPSGRRPRRAGAASSRSRTRTRSARGSRTPPRRAAAP